MDNKNDITSRYSSDDQTQRYQNIDKTQAYGAAKEEAKKTHGISIGDSLKLNGIGFEVTEILSSNTGEAIIYKVRDPSGVDRVLKLYYAFRHVRDEPNAIALEKISKIEDPDVLRLYDFAVTGHKEMYKGEYCFELSELAKGGDLMNVDDWKAKYTPEFVWDAIVDELFKGIRKLHDNQIIHTDIKPSNIFYLDEIQKDIVIGDYGSSKTFDEELSDSRMSSRVMGTQFYRPTEQATGQISKSVDYFAFGMTLIHLLYPEQVAKDDNYTQIERTKEKTIRERLYKGEVPVLFNESAEYVKLNKLIQGLTQDHYTTRWSEHEVKAFYSEGKDVPIKSSSIVGSDAVLELHSDELHNNRDVVKYFLSGSFGDGYLKEAYDRNEIVKFLRKVNDRTLASKVNDCYRNFQALNGTDSQVKNELVRWSSVFTLNPYQGIGDESKFEFPAVMDNEELKMETTRYLALLVNKINNDEGDIADLISGLYQLEFRLGMHPYGKFILKRFWNNFGVKDRIPDEFDAYTPKAYNVHKNINYIKSALSDFVFRLWEKEVQKTFRLDLVNEDRSAYTVSYSLKNFLEQNNFPNVFSQINTDHYVDYGIKAIAPYDDFIDHNYKSIRQKVKEKHEGIMMPNEFEDKEIIRQFLTSDSNVIWNLFCHHGQAQLKMLEGLEYLDENKVKRYVLFYTIENSLDDFCKGNSFPLAKKREASSGKYALAQPTLPKKFEYFQNKLVQYLEVKHDEFNPIENPSSIDGIITSNNIIISHTNLNSFKDVFENINRQKKMLLALVGALILFIFCCLFVFYIKDKNNDKLTAKMWEETLSIDTPEGYANYLYKDKPPKKTYNELAQMYEAIGSKERTEILKQKIGFYKGNIATSPLKNAKWHLLDGHGVLRSYKPNIYLTYFESGLFKHNSGGKEYAGVWTQRYNEIYYMFSAGSEVKTFRIVSTSNGGWLDTFNVKTIDGGSGDMKTLKKQEEI